MLLLSIVSSTWYDMLHNHVGAVTLPLAHMLANLNTRVCCHLAERGGLRFNLHRFRQYDEQQLLLPGLIAELLAAVGLQPFTTHTWASLAACGIEVVRLAVLLLCCVCMLCHSAPLSDAVGGRGAAGKLHRCGTCDCRCNCVIED
jgi:hypothetical protein